MMKKNFILLSMCVCMSWLTNAQVIDEILASGSQLVQDVLSHPDKYEVQIIYSQIFRDADGLPSIVTHEYGVDELRYFYPASTVKFPVAMMALEKLNELKDERITRRTPIVFGSMKSPQLLAVQDASAENDVITIDHLMKKIFLVSDNDANNLLYSFCGHDFIKSKLEQKGYDKVRIADRVGNGSFSHENNKSTNSYLFYEDGEVLFVSPGVTGGSDARLTLNDCIKGKAYFSKGKIINQPFNFCEKNFVSLPTLHDMLIAVTLPEATSPEKQWNITTEQRKAVLSYMSQRPRESEYPNYGPEYYDSYVKFFVVGDDQRPMPDGLRIFNKVGNAYGYLTDVSYIVDLDRGKEFVLAATVHVNENETYNDDTYQYDTIGYPFLAEIGRLFYKFEQARNHTFNPQALRQLIYD